MLRAKCSSFEVQTEDFTISSFSPAFTDYQQLTVYLKTAKLSVQYQSWFNQHNQNNRFISINFFISYPKFQIVKSESESI